MLVELDEHGKPRVDVDGKKLYAVLQEKLKVLGYDDLDFQVSVVEPLTENPQILLIPLWAVKNRKVHDITAHMDRTTYEILKFSDAREPTPPR